MSISRRRPEPDESRIEALNEQFCAADFFSRTPADERAVLETEHRTLTEKVRERMDAWEILENELGGLPKD